MQPEEILVIAAYSDALFDGAGKLGKLVRQDRPHCCGSVINLFSTMVTFKEIVIDQKQITLIEPYCPYCGNKVTARYQILS